MRFNYEKKVIDYNYDNGGIYDDRLLVKKVDNKKDSYRYL